MDVAWKNIKFITSKLYIYVAYRYVLTKKVVKCYRDGVNIIVPSFSKTSAFPLTLYLRASFRPPLYPYEDSKNGDGDKLPLYKNI